MIVLVTPFAALAERAVAHDPGIAADHAADRAAVVPLLAALLAGEPLTPAEGGAVVLEALQGWRARSVVAQSCLGDAGRRVG